MVCASGYLLTGNVYRGEREMSALVRCEHLLLQVPDSRSEQAVEVVCEFGVSDRGRDSILVSL